MFCIGLRSAECAGAASTAPSSSRRAAVTRSSASRARTHWFRAAAMATLRWAAIVGPLTSMTLAPCARAIATVSSVEPPSATMTSSAQRSDANASAICHASLSVGITTVRGSEAGGTEGMGGARSGMTSSGCERSGLRLGCWSRGCPLIIQHAFRRHTVVMTTLLLAHDFPPLGGGIARLHGELARRYPAGELIVSTPQDPDAGDVDAQFNGAVDRLPIGRRTTKSLPGLLLWSRRAASLTRQHGVRFVHCGNVKPAGYPARWVLERCRVPYSVFLYGADVLSEQHKIRQSVFKRRTARAVFGGAAALVAISGWTRDLVLSVLGDLGLDGHGQRLRVVHLGTDPERFRPGVDTDELRHRFELPDGGARWLLTVARLEPHKGVDTVIRALPAIVERAADVRYAVAGSGPEREHLEKLAHKTGVAERVRFLGEVGDRDLPALYNLATVYVGASRRAERIGVEGFGLALVEASACGLPVVAGNSGGVPDAVRDGETGFLVPAEDPAAFADAISRLLGDPGLARRVGAAGRRAVETYFNWDRVVRDLRAIESEVVA